MAFEEVVDHPKFMRLKRLMGCGRQVALGALEGVWIFAAKYCPDGNVGAYSSEEVESWLEYDGPAGTLFPRLMEAGFLDDLGGGRIYIHDWHHYAKDKVQMRLAREGRLFANGARPSVKRIAIKQRPEIEAALDIAEREFRANGSASGSGEAHRMPTVCAHDAHDERTTSTTPTTTPSTSQGYEEPDGSSCPEPASGSRTAAAGEGDSSSPVVLEFPVKAGRSAPKTWCLHQAKLDEWCETYGCDVLPELGFARQWLLDNPKKQKTARGMTRYLGNWLSRANDSGKLGRNATAGSPPTEYPELDFVPRDPTPEELRLIEEAEAEWQRAH